MKTGERRPELDGVRGIAILLVLVGHADHRLAPLAAAGVALFFTLSGYLITGLLLTERARTGRLDLRRFYARRFTRLAPPLFVMLAVMGILLRPNWAALATAGSWTANYAMVFGVDVAPFGHTWSLAVEEQFYLVWPVALLLLLRRRDPARALQGIIFGLVAWWALVAATGHLQYAYGALETAGVPILAGCLVALRGNLTPRFRLWEGLAGLLLLAGGSALLGGGSWWMVPMLSVPFMATIVANANGCRWLAWRPLGFCGVASYSMYLWHAPVSWAVKHELSPLGVAAGVLVGLVAWRLVEVPVMRWRQGRRAPTSVVAASPEAVLLGR